MADQDFDRTEDATPHKLAEARKKGNVAKSVDMTAAGLLAVLAMTLYASGWNTLRDTVRLQRRVLAHMSEGDWGAEQASHWFGQLLMGGLQLLAPLFLALVLTALAVGFFQTGAVFSFHAVSPDLNRLHPVEGFKRLFSLRTLYEACKSVFKLGVLTAVAYAAITSAIPGLTLLAQLDARSYPQALLRLSTSLLIKMVAVLVVVAAIDHVYTRWQYARQMRMSRRDVKDESKHREGDPRIRSRIRQLRREMLKRTQAMRKLPSADVLLINPTHIAVAITYDHAISGAPKVIAKGAGGLARKMREVAAKHRIPVVENRPLARALYREVENEDFVPEHWYPQVAKILVWVYAMRESRATLQSGRTA
jgi:flagellar biosynthesis protein FlhB